MLKLIDLILFYILNWSVAWVLTNSVLLKEPREILSNWFFSQGLKRNAFIRFVFNKLDYLITCIICTGIWTSLILLYLASKSSYLLLGGNTIDYFLISLSSPFFTMLFTNIIYSDSEEEEEND